MDVLAAAAVPAAMLVLSSPLWPAAGLCSVWALGGRQGVTVYNAGMAVPAIVTFLLGASTQSIRMPADSVLGLFLWSAFVLLLRLSSSWAVLGLDWPERVIVLEAALLTLATWARVLLLEVRWRSVQAEGGDTAALEPPASPVLFVVHTLVAAAALLALLLSPLIVRVRRDGGGRPTPAPAFVSAVFGGAVACIGGLASFVLEWKLDASPLGWFLAFFAVPSRAYLVAWWLFVLVVMLLVAGRGGSPGVDGSRPPPTPLPIARKLFHVALVAIMLPPLVMGPIEHAAVAIGTAAAVLLLTLLELFRALRVQPLALSGALSSFMGAFVDSRDGGALYVTHLYLLLGCAAPVWLSYARTRPVGSPPLPALIELAAGLLAVGIGDAAAAITGVSLSGAGRAHTWGWAADHALTALGSPDDDEEVPAAAAAAAGAGPVADDATPAPVRRRRRSVSAPRAAAARSAPTLAVAATISAPPKGGSHVFTFAGAEKTVEGSAAFVAYVLLALLLCHWARTLLVRWSGTELGYGATFPGLSYWRNALGVAFAGSVLETAAGSIDNALMPALMWAAAASIADRMDAQGVAR